MDDFTSCLVGLIFLVFESLVRRVPFFDFGFRRQASVTYPIRVVFLKWLPSHRRVRAKLTAREKRKIYSPLRAFFEK